MKDIKLTVSPLTAADVEDAANFFEAIAADPAAGSFHPHPFNRAEAVRVCNYSGEDLYLGARTEGVLVGYGLLRGWDEGYIVPSLGIYLSPSARGLGLGTIFLRHLHAHARAKGAMQVMLKVYPSNVAAISLYQSVGYGFSGNSAGQLIGHVDI